MRTTVGWDSTFPFQLLPRTKQSRDSNNASLILKYYLTFISKILLTKDINICVYIHSSPPPHRNTHTQERGHCLSLLLQLRFPLNRCVTATSSCQKGGHLKQRMLLFLIHWWIYYPARLNGIEEHTPGLSPRVSRQLLPISLHLSTTRAVTEMSTDTSVPVVKLPKYFVGTAPWVLLLPLCLLPWGSPNLSTTQKLIGWCLTQQRAFRNYLNIGQCHVSC